MEEDVSHGTLLSKCAAPVFLLALGLICYGPSLSAPFIFDDEVIVKNPGVHHLWPAWAALRGTILAGRPVSVLSFSLNYAVGGLDPWGYHAFNLGIHVLAALLLYGIVRRTLVGPRFAERFGPAAPALALAAAALWLAHPLQTEPVTYVTQRTELLMGMFYLLTVYCALRAWDGRRPALWSVASVLSCALGMGSKEVMISAPFMVVLYDRAFRRHSLVAAIRARRGLYAGLAATWGILAALMILDPHDNTFGFHTRIPVWAYARAQLAVVIHYLGLAVWPVSLCLDCGAPAQSTAALLFHGLVLGTLLIVSVWALWRNRPVGFLGAWFFLILAPTSSVVPIATEVMAERRMYLPLAAVVLLAVLLAATAAQLPQSRLATRLGICTALVALAILSLLTMRRNRDYNSPITIWTDTANKNPRSPRAHTNLGAALLDAGRRDDAVREFGEALRLDPEYPNIHLTHYNLGVALMQLGKPDEAIAHYREALRFRPGYVQAHNNLGVALLSVGLQEEGASEFAAALRYDPDYVSAHENLGRLLLGQGKMQEAEVHLAEVVRRDPRDEAARNDLAAALLAQGRVADAMAQISATLRLNPASVRAHYVLGGARWRQGDLDGAVEALTEATRLGPDSLEAHFFLAQLLMQQGKPSDSVSHFRETLRLDPGHGQAHYMLGVALESLGQLQEAAAQYAAALDLMPDARDAAARLAVVREHLVSHDRQAGSEHVAGEPVVTMVPGQ